MRLRSFATFSILLASGCAHGPQVSPCVFEAAAKGCYYVPQGQVDVLLRTEAEMDKNVCFTPDEAQALAEWIKNHRAQLKVQGVDPDTLLAMIANTQEAKTDSQ